MHERRIQRCIWGYHPGSHGNASNFSIEILRRKRIKKQGGRRAPYQSILYSRCARDPHFTFETAEGWLNHESTLDRARRGISHQGLILVRFSKSKGYLVKF
jgi:hypothetical protein